MEKESLDGIGNALFIGLLIALAGVGVLCWVVRLCVVSVWRYLRSSIRAAMNKRGKGSS